MTHYVICFTLATASYRCHMETCSAAKSTRRQRLIPAKFPSVVAAEFWANGDESEKAGERCAANFNACRCAKVRP